MRTTTDTAVLGGTPVPQSARYWPSQPRVPATLVTRSIRPQHHPLVARSEAALPANVSQRFGVKLRALRASRNMTQQTMARRFGIDRSFISDLERGRKSISLVTLEVLALGLGVSISELLSNV